jgi:hypothetical protein
MRAKRKTLPFLVPDETPVHVVKQRRVLKPFLPQWPPVVVRDFVKNDAARERLCGWLLRVEEWGLVDEIDGYTRIERGALVRLSVVLPRSVKRASRFGLQLYEVLRECVRNAQMLEAMIAADSVECSRFASVLDEQVQRLMDLLVEAEKELDPFALQSLAGLGGCDVQALRRLGASSGIEAALHVAWCIRRAVRGQERPFSSLALREPKRDRRQVGRTAPHSPLATERDDKAILLSVFEGVHDAKGISKAVSRYGAKACTPGHVRKRKMDLVKWGLFEKRVRDFRLTDAGIEWVHGMRPPQLGQLQP